MGSEKLTGQPKLIDIKSVGQFYLENWKPEEANELYDILEKPNWAPWLEASIDSLKGRSLVFPEGQLLLRNMIGLPVASLSTNKINWDGDCETLPTWDQVAGNPTTYKNTYVHNGNTMALMSMNVHLDYQGAGLARTLIEAIKNSALDLGITYLLGSFRPNGFGKFKAQPGLWDTDFGHYCQLLREDGWPIDGWLRSLVKNGMKPLKVDKNAMTVIVGLADFYNYQQYYNVDMWLEVAPKIWECGEVGQWKVDINSETATYKESNLWGELPIK